MIDMEAEESEVQTDISHFSYDEIEKALHNIDLKIAVTSLMMQLHIIENRKASADECEYILNILCLLHLKYIANSVYDEEPELGTMIYWDYLEFIKELEVDFKHFIIIAGNDFFKSDFYEYDGESGENQVLTYLIHKEYSRVIRFLKSHYGDAQTMLNEVIRDQYFYDDYVKAVHSIITLEDYFDEVESVKLYTWADGGFDISGEA